MSTNRVSKTAGWVDLKRHPKGPNGRGLCRQCEQEVPKGRRTFCSQDCVDRWTIKTSPSHVRALVFRRDKGVCALCGLDTVQWGKERTREWRALHPRSGEPFTMEYREVSAAREAFRRQHPHFFTRQTYWDADHIVPVVEGGGECDLDNYRTLCLPCHRQVTADLAKRRADRRKRAKQQATGMQELGL